VEGEKEPAETVGSEVVGVGLGEGVGETGVVEVSEVVDGDEPEEVVLVSTDGEDVPDPVVELGAGVMVSPEPVSQTLPSGSVAIPFVIVVPLAKRNVPLL
jgi:hypothetical protein